MKQSDPRSVLIRASDDGTQSLGMWLVLADTAIKKTLATLEPEWADNKQRQSCIPWGRYTLRKRWSPRHKWHFHVLDVRGRTWILTHKGAYRKNTLGCIVVGMSHEDINGDGKLDTADSDTALKILLELLPEVSTLDIVPVLP